MPEIHEFHANLLNSWLHSLITLSSLLHNHIFIIIILHSLSFLISFWVLRKSCWSRKIDFNMARSRFITFFRDFSEIPLLLPFPAPFAATFQISAATFSFFCRDFLTSLRLPSSKELFTRPSWASCCKVRTIILSCSAGSSFSLFVDSWDLFVYFLAS